MTQKSQTGMTLIELMIVVVVISILASIAVPGYRNYVIRTNRTEAKTALLSTAAALERCYTQYRRYDSDDCATSESLPFDLPSGNYTIARSADSSSTEFTLTATPKGSQAADVGCGTLSLDDKNMRGKTGSKAVSECWNH
jgi:type IV pilus assembly protein PilE